MARRNSFEDLKRLVESLEKGAKTSKDQTLDNYERLDKIVKEQKEDTFDRHAEFKSLIHSLDSKVQALEDWKEARKHKTDSDESSEEEENS